MTILITGASRGIGASTALQLARGGHRLILLARSEKELKEVCLKCNEIAGVEAAVPLRFDLTDLIDHSGEFEKLLGTVTQSLDTLVNNAGLLINKPFKEFTPAMSKEVFAANYFAPEQLIRSCLPFLEKSEYGSIINITSMGAVQGSAKFPGLSVYSASKGALATLTECLAEELKHTGIRVNALAFGAVQTEMLEQAFPGIRASTGPMEMGSFLSWFITEGYRRFNGKMLPVSDSTP